MLTIFEGGYNRTCEGTSRREFLKVGSLGLGGLSLSTVMQGRAGASQYESPLRDKSVVLLFLGGGPPQTETFDPKMTAPAGIRSMQGEVKTTLPGVTYGATFEQLARWAHKTAVVRSFRHGGSNSHARATAYVVTGGNDTEAMLGSVYSRVAGTNHSVTGMPTNVFVPPAAVAEEYEKFSDYKRRLALAGELGATYKPFDPSGGGEVRKNMELKIPRKRLDDRRALLASLDRLKRHAENSDVLSGIDQYTQQAFDVILGGISKAFDLSEENPKLVARYDTSHIKIPGSVIKKKRKGIDRQSPAALGKQMLMARRLCEAGCGFVTIPSTGWDLHGNRFGVDDGMPVLGRAVDHAVSAFIEDVEARGLSEKILLVVTGEFGRTPRINKKAGRDHWSRLTPLFLAGGGLKMGQVIGRSDRHAASPDSDPLHIRDMRATVLHTLFDPGILRLHPDIPAEIKQAVGETEPIRQLL